jgi:hypothetical protein
MTKFLIVFAFSLTCFAGSSLKADDEVIDATVRKTPTVGYSDENPEKCQFGTNAGTFGDMTGAYVTGMTEPQVDKDGKKVQ